MIEPLKIPTAIVYRDEDMREFIQLLGTQMLKINEIIEHLNQEEVNK